MHHRAKRTAQAGVFFAAEELRTPEGRPQLRHDRDGLFVVDAPRLAATNGAEPHPLVIIVVEDIQRPGVICDHAQQRLGLVGGDIVPIKHLADDAQRLFQFLQAPLVHRVALQQVVARRAWPRCGTACRVRVHAVADREDRVEVEVLDLALYRAPAFILNCCKKCNSCRPI